MQTKHPSFALRTNHVCAFGSAAAALLAAAAFSACGTDSSPAGRGARQADPISVLFAPKDGEPVASTKSGDVLLTMEELKEHARQQSPFTRHKYATTEGQIELVDQLVKLELLAREAARTGMHHQPEVQQALKRAMVNQLLATRLQEPEAGVEISEERLHQFYQENITDYVQPERVRVSHVFFAAESDEDRSSARAEARRHLSELRAAGQREAATFSRIAREASDDSDSKTRGGDLRYLSREELSEAWGSRLADAAFALEEAGAISEVIEGAKGFHILRFIGRQRGVERTIDDVRPQLMNRARREERNRRFEEFVNELRSAEGAIVHKEVLERAASQPEELTETTRTDIDSAEGDRDGPE